MGRKVLLVGALAALVASSEANADVNYVMAIRNITNQPISVKIEPYSLSSCITYGNATQDGVNWDIAPTQSRYISFWRSGDCHGEQGWLAVAALGPALPSDGNGADDYQQFWFDTDGGFSTQGNNSKYAKTLTNMGQPMSGTVFLELRIGCCNQ